MLKRRKLASVAPEMKTVVADRVRRQPVDVDVGFLSALRSPLSAAIRDAARDAGDDLDVAAEPDRDLEPGISNGRS